MKAKRITGKVDEAGVRRGRWTRREREKGSRSKSGREKGKKENVKRGEFETK